MLVNRRNFLASAATITAGAGSLSVSLAAKSYMTNFPLVENTISENGAWTHLASPWAYLRTMASPQRVVGTQTGSGGYNDSYAYLSGFGPHVNVQATIYKNPATLDPEGHTKSRYCCGSRTLRRLFVATNAIWLSMGLILRSRDGMEHSATTPRYLTSHPSLPARCLPSRATFTRRVLLAD
jgi:hypothetical protein